MCVCCVAWCGVVFIKHYLFFDYTMPIAVLRKQSCCSKLISGRRNFQFATHMYTCTHTRTCKHTLTCKHTHMHDTCTQHTYTHYIVCCSYCRLLHQPKALRTRSKDMLQSEKTLCIQLLTILCHLFVVCSEVVGDMLMKISTLISLISLNAS